MPADDYSAKADSDLKNLQFHARNTVDIHQYNNEESMYMFGSCLLFH